jgi:UDP-2,3-diacylglucosamine hydrolase
LNKISIEGPAWLASDIHLGPDNPETAKLFFAFLDKASAHAGALFLLGDIFDVGIGDDWADQPPVWLSQALAHLQQTGKQIPLFIGHGNRDFLMGQRLAARLGAQLLDDQCLLQIHKQCVLLAHGDEFCTTDHAYQRFRKIVRHPWVQKLYLSLSLNQRMAIAHRARLKSIKTQANPNAVWHDVTLAQIDQTLKQADTRVLIHGHTHKPGHYPSAQGSAMIDRWVLPDWEADHLEPGQARRGGWIVINDSGLELFTVDGTVAIST